MVASTAASRTASVMSNSKPRGVIKRRGKPYKTEQHKVVAKKLKLNIEDSYQKTAKPGYTFLPFGTPDLADLCKELSRQRSLPMHNVHATPRHEHATNPAKVSHHTHRIGYHFRCQVVEDACERLGYVPYGGIFIAAADHAQKQYDSVIASAFAKQGVTYNGDQAKRNKESPEQIRAAIKELFPKIPQYDLDEVVAHAWDEKAMRVGRAKGLTLSQRVQYAVVARIRHTYTDYDTLLAAKLADWKTCRKEVEPFTLEKVFEWRGETDGDDEGLEEIVRETIVIDDDDDDDVDDDAPIVINSDDSSDTGYASDSSIEISSRPAAAEDLRAEEASGRDHAFSRRRNSGRMHQRTDLARQMIHRHRNKEHNDRAYAYNQAGTYQHPPAGRVQRTYGASLSTVASPGQIIVGGQVMRLPPDTQSYAHPPGQYLQHDRPMQSIERGDHTYIQPPPPGSSPLPEVPPPPGLSSPAWRSTDIPPPPPPQSPPPPPPGPPPQAWHSHTAPQATRLAQPNYHGAGLVQDFPGYAQPSHAFPLDQYDRKQAYPQAQLGGNGMDFTPSPRRVYDERLLAQSEVIRVIASGDGRYFEAPTQSGWRQREQIPSEHAYRPAQPTVQYTYSAPGAYLAPAPATAAPPRTYTQPVHGAPAPVQQMPRELAQPRPARLARYDHVAADPYRQSVYGAPQHAQYYPR